MIEAISLPSRDGRRAVVAFYVLLAAVAAALRAFFICLKDQGVDYLCYWTPHDSERLSGDYGNYRVKYWNRFYRTFSDEIPVRQEDEVFRSQTFYYGQDAQGTPFNVVVWRLP